MTRLVNSDPKPQRELTNQDVIDYIESLNLKPIRVLVENNKVMVLETDEKLSVSQINMIKARYTSLIEE